MSGLLFLTTDDFKLIGNKNNDSKILINNISGFSLILFYSKQCEYCKSLEPIFMKLPGTITGCHFGQINIGKNKDVIRMSQQSITPITYVPLVILYYNKKPYMRYDGPSDINEIQNFVLEVASSIQRQIGDENNNEQFEEEETGYVIPDYCIARPTKGGLKEKICYINFSDAYE